MEVCEMGELANLFNIGKEVERQLNEVGITTGDALRQIGSKDAWLRIKKIDDSACIHRLYALESLSTKVCKFFISPCF